MSTLTKTPVITKMTVVPVAGYDSMLMTLSGAHAPVFTRNLVILEDYCGHLTGDTVMFSKIGPFGTVRIFLI